ncbi:uncharacterized protein F5891DRAFT_982894 [Suillus fuscotomentosus]|uniref:Uncharacterized protein n=1 Tax=Suillus fuscotomentosus TaxID=1912939 RepID=A0AAD4DZR0_9AGAM|nr:uncharacterized protein F5891DRAFT_982894 [Suillus fuscotomentosus]KAG1897085.1 hypothetical protein F5891DRAFT_982894 [Suillus fuscotomentosus]
MPRDERWVTSSLRNLERESKHSFQGMMNIGCTTFEEKGPLRQQEAGTSRCCCDLSSIIFSVFGPLFITLETMGRTEPVQGLLTLRLFGSRSSAQTSTQLPFLFDGGFAWLWTRGAGLISQSPSIIVGSSLISWTIGGVVEEVKVMNESRLEVELGEDRGFTDSGLENELNFQESFSLGDNSLSEVFNEHKTSADGVLIKFMSFLGRGA